MNSGQLCCIIPHKVVKYPNTMQALVLNALWMLVIYCLSYVSSWDVTIFVCTVEYRMRMKKNIVFALKLFYLKFFSSPRTDSEGGRGREVVGANIVINTIIAMMQCAPV